MRRTTIVCDRCGKEIPPDKINNFVGVPARLGGGGLDLCDTCMDGLCAWYKQHPAAVGVSSDDYDDLVGDPEWA